jgi:uncharacterized delta-60 repeat protein
MKNHYYFLFSIICFLFSISVNAQPGNLDSDFDSDGKLTVDFDLQNDQAFAVAVQPDGKIIVAGYARIAGDDDFAMARFNTDGTYDATFGTGGKVTTSFSANDEQAFALLLQPDGNIILAGNTYNGTYDFAMARYTSTGALDNTFSNDGILYTDFENSADVCKTAALQPDGKIILAGEKFGQAGIEFGLIRYNSDGTLDNTFGTGGKVTTSFGINPIAATISSIAVQPDGKIIAGGQTLVNGTGENNFFALTRYNADGTLDNTFSVDGKVTTDLANGDLSRIHSITLQPDGYIVAAGTARISNNYYIALARYRTDGTLDTGFDGDGKLTSDVFSTIGQINAVLIQSDGKIIAAGQVVLNGTQGFGIVRLNADGSPDNTFGTAGTVFTDFNGVSAIAYAAAIQPDLKIVLAGQFFNGVRDFAVARYLSGLNLGTLEFSPNATALIYPNPLNETTVLSFELTTNELLNISIYDMQGRKTKSLNENQFYAAGKHELSIDAASLAGGQYLLVLENGKGKSVIRLQK